MPLETGSFVNDLTPSNPPSSDPAGQGDDHLRLIKAVLQGTFPQMGAVLGQVRRQDTALSISSTWNTNHFICSASATATVVLTLPPATSITAGFYVDITTIGTGTVSLLPSGAASINGGVSLSVPRLNTARAYFLGGTAWLADIVPHAQGGTSVITNLAVDGTLSVSGNAVLGGTLSLSGNATFGGNVNVSGATTLSGAVTMKGTMSISGNATLGGSLSVSGVSVLSGNVFVGGIAQFGSTVTVSGTVVLTIGQIAFPGTQVPNAGANVLDDYEEGTWTPALNYNVTGNLSTVYSTQIGSYVKIGKQVTVRCTLATSTFTHTTASGVLFLTGLPFTSAANHKNTGACSTGGWTITTDFMYITAQLVGSATSVQFYRNGTNRTNQTQIDATHHTSGDNVTIEITITYDI